MYQDAGLIVKRIRQQDPNRNQTDFGRLLGVSRQTIASWEAGATAPDGPLLARLYFIAEERYREDLMEAYTMPAVPGNPGSNGVHAGVVVKP
jgi:DNA-binding XRE family transcriptional regulator